MKAQRRHHRLTLTLILALALALAPNPNPNPDPSPSPSPNLSPSPHQERIKKINPTVSVMRTEQSKADPSQLIGISAFKLEKVRSRSPRDHLEMRR